MQELGSRSSGHWVAGHPAPFATAQERVWRDLVRVALTGDLLPPAGGHLHLAFTVGATTAWPLGPDLDNLCDPVMATVCRELRWFGGGRRGIGSYSATKSVGDERGCLVSIEPPRPSPPGEVLLEGHYERMPQGARDEVFAAWAAESMLRTSRLAEHLAVDLTLSPATNIAEISTGLVKKAIDGLYPVLGGIVGQPADDRVTRLMVRRGDSGFGGVQVVVSVA